MRNSLSLTLYRLLYILLAMCLIACGRRGDPIAIIPYKDVGVVQDLKAFIKDDKTYLRWGMPQGFPVKAVKGFVIYSSEVSDEATINDCKCEFEQIDFVMAEKGMSSFEYIDRKADRSKNYMYKVVVKDKEGMMGKDSNIVLIKRVKAEVKKALSVPEAPLRLKGIFTEKGNIITWDEVREEIKFYRIYRSEDKNFVVIGESATAVYIDKDVVPSRRYFYKVAAVADVEGPLSERLEIITNP